MFYVRKKPEKCFITIFKILCLSSSVAKVYKLQSPVYKTNTLVHFLTAEFVNSTRIVANILKKISQRMQEI